MRRETATLLLLIAHALAPMDDNAAHALAHDVEELAAFVNGFAPLPARAGEHRAGMVPAACYWQCQRGDSP